MKSTIRSKLQLEDVEVESISGRDGQGKVSYGTAVTIEAHAVHETVLIVGPDGNQENATLTLYVPGDEAVLPAVGARVTQDGSPFIVRERSEYKNFDRTGSLDHVRLRCREE